LRRSVLSKWSTIIMGGTNLHKAKPFSISKMAVLTAFNKIKANKGAAGVDKQSIADFEKDLKSNLYKVWNRMSSGSYFPPPVRLVEIPKKGGGKRGLGIPTVLDRIAQMVVKLHLEPELEPYFHPDSYGYRPGKSSIQAISKVRERCWKYDWVVDIDIKGFFDNIDHELMMRAVRKHVRQKWIQLYIERWLKVPVQTSKNQRIFRGKGTPQGGVISPLLANLFLHYAFDVWMKRKFPHIPFARYADDIVIHCITEKQALWIKQTLEERLKECNLEINQEKTKIIYCQDANRTMNYSSTQFCFLGYTFKARTSRNRRGKLFMNFLPAADDNALKEIRDKIRNWKIHRKINLTLEDIERTFNPILRGWFNYYGRFYKSRFYTIFRMFNCILVKWARRKYKSLRSRGRALKWFVRIADKSPNLFVHWRIGVTP
jgi:RNA-directed DNA polymerase